MRRSYGVLRKRASGDRSFDPSRLLARTSERFELGEIDLVNLEVAVERRPRDTEKLSRSTAMPRRRLQRAPDRVHARRMSVGTGEIQGRGRRSFGGNARSALGGQVFRS